MPASTLRRRSFLGLTASLLLTACGGGGDIISPASAQTAPAATAPTVDPIVGKLHCILRPDENGNWYIQDDTGHRPVGIYPVVTQTASALRIAFDHSWKYAGTIQITSDDEFGTVVTGHASLGKTSAELQVRANGQVIDPATVWNYLPNKSGGNFWINVTMVD